MDTPKTPEEKQAYMEQLSKTIAEANQDIREATAGRYSGSYDGQGSELYYPGLMMPDAGYEDASIANQYKNMREADKAYREVGIVRNVIDIMTDFASEGLNIVHPVAAQERFYRAWAKKVHLDEIIRQILQGLYKWGNVGLFRFLGKVPLKTRKEMMAKARELFAQGKDKEALKAFFKQDTTFAKARIPVRYSCIPPFRIKIWGTLLFNERKYFFRMTSADMERFRDPKIASELEKKLMEQMPEEARELFATDGMILLPVENFSMFHYKRDCARLWADPLLLPIMDDLRYKKVLRRLDVS
ncbi:MAG: hypothetical protein MN733_20255, partial [Nitrososphaera sp.]|nr:hypothetical protein [Nitrososphaera sp.]